MICIGFWALFHLINQNFVPIKSDFYFLYTAGKRVLNEPANLYNQQYFLLPVFAMISSVTFALLPYFYAYYTFYLLNIAFGILLIRESNKILILMELKEKEYRFLFLIVISNGFIILAQFYQNQYKILMGVILFFIIRRELWYRIKEIEKSIKYYIINYGLFVLVVGIFPPFIFLLLIYIFNDIQFVNLFKKESIIKYTIVILMFAIQNFLIFIYPSYLLDFLSLYGRHNQRGYFPLFYLREWVVLDNYNFIFYISTIYITIIALILILNNKLSIEEKFAYNSFAWIIFSTYGGRTLVILFPLALLLYIPLLNKEERGIAFFKKNKIIMLGLASVIGIYFMLPDYTIYKYIPWMQEFPFIILMNLRYIFLLSVFAGSIFILHLERFKSKKLISSKD